MLNKKFEFLILISFLVLCAHQADADAAAATDQRNEANVVRRRKGLEDLFRPPSPDSLLGRLIRKRPRPKNPVYPDPTRSRSNENYHDIQVLNRGDNRGFLFDAKNILNDKFMLFNDFNNEDVGNILLVDNESAAPRTHQRIQKKSVQVEPEAEDSNSEADVAESRQIEDYDEPPILRPYKDIRRFQQARGQRYLRNQQQQQQPLIRLNIRPLRGAGGRIHRRQPYQNLNEGPRGRKNKNQYASDEDDDAEDPGQDFRQGSGLRDLDDVIKGSRLREQNKRKVPEKGIRNVDLDGDRFNSAPFRNKNRPSPLSDHLSGANPEDAVYYDDVFIDEAGDDYKDQPNLDPEPFSKPNLDKVPPQKFKIVPHVQRPQPLFLGVPRRTPGFRPQGLGNLGVVRQSPLFRAGSRFRDPEDIGNQQLAELGPLDIDDVELTLPLRHGGGGSGIGRFQNAANAYDGDDDDGGFGPFKNEPEDRTNGKMGFYKKPDSFPTLQELSGGFSTNVEQKVAAPASLDRSARRSTN